MAIKKHEVVSYVLVENSTGGSLRYFTGILSITQGLYTSFKPQTSTAYSEALKLCFKDEAERYCERLNVQLKDKYYSFHVEEHAYADDTHDRIQKVLDEFQKEHDLTNDEMTRLLEYTVRCHELKKV